jgi:hypothetical protein
MYLECRSSKIRTAENRKENQQAMKILNYDAQARRDCFVSGESESFNVCIINTSLLACSLGLKCVPVFLACLRLFSCASVLPCCFSWARDHLPGLHFRQHLELQERRPLALPPLPSTSHAVGPDPTIGQSRKTRGCTSVERALDAKARTAIRRELEATSKNLGLRLWLTWSRGLSPMCPGSDGF